MPDDGRSHHALQLIERYELIAQASHEMLAAARHDDWESVTRLEDACRALIDELRRERASVPGVPLSAAEQRRRIALLRAILADDAEIRERAEPWLQQLEHLFRPLHAPPSAAG